MVILFEYHKKKASVIFGPFLFDQSFLGELVVLVDESVKKKEILYYGVTC